MYEAKNYEQLLGIEGFSDSLLRNHFVLYEGYVSNVNKILEFLKTAETGTPPFSEIKRRFGWEWDGIRLHELYFGNMGKNGSELDKKSAFVKKITEDFGSFEVWEKDFKAIGMMRGIGWVALVRDNETNRLFNVWITEHDGGHLTGSTILLVMDVFEHAYVSDYGIKRLDYINVFWNAILWSAVVSRFSGK